MMITCGLKVTSRSVPSTPRARSSGLGINSRSVRCSSYPFVMPQVPQLSQEAHDRLATEFQDLTTRGRIDIARKIETARELGDLSENGDYHAAKEEQGKMEGRILHLESILENSEIADAVGAALKVMSAPSGTERSVADVRTKVGRSPHDTRHSCICTYVVRPITSAQTRSIHAAKSKSSSGYLSR